VAVAPLEDQLPSGKYEVENPPNKGRSRKGHTLLSDENKTFIRVAADKLRLLQRHLDRSKQASESDLRDIISPNLRALLIENAYGNAWSLLSGRTKKATVSAMDLNKLPKSFLDSTEFMQAGGGTQGGMQMGGMGFSIRPFDPLQTEAERLAVAQEFQRIALLTKEKEKLPLQRFLSSPCIVSRGIFASRRQIIRYVANKLGGVHYDRKRIDKDAKAFQMLDSLTVVKGSILFAGVHGSIYWEFLSIGQDFVDSEDAKQFISRANEFGL
jgi:hypothetical protein